jgi:hypothetical protein
LLVRRAAAAQGSVARVTKAMFTPLIIRPSKSDRGALAMI